MGSNGNKGVRFGRFTALSAWTGSSGNTGGRLLLAWLGLSPSFTCCPHPTVSDGGRIPVRSFAIYVVHKPIAFSPRPQSISIKNREPRTGSSTIVLSTQTPRALYSGKRGKAGEGDQTNQPRTAGIRQAGNRDSEVGGLHRSIGRRTASSHHSSQRGRAHTNPSSIWQCVRGTFEERR